MDGTPRRPRLARKLQRRWGPRGWGGGGGQVHSGERGESGSGTRVGECEPFRVRAVVGKELKCVSEKGKTS